MTVCQLVVYFLPMEPWAYDSIATRALLLLYVTGRLPGPLNLPVARTDESIAVTRMIISEGKV